MVTLQSNARIVRQVSRPAMGGARVSLTEFVLLLRPSSPDRLPAGVLAKTYTNKPLVHVDGEDLFGELAVLRLLQKDAWDGVWVDTFHGNGREALFWTAMPHRSVPIQLEPSSAGRRIYDRIKDHRDGRIGGFFDILAWRGKELVFIEYKGPSDSANENEPSFLEAALSVGISPSQFFYVTASADVSDRGHR